MLNTRTGPGRTGAAPTDTEAARPGRVAALVAGDLVVFLIFAAQGRSAHGESETVGAIIVTAAPFIIGWLAVAPWLGAFGRRGSAATTRPAPLLQRTALAWVAAWAVALMLRLLVFRRDITFPFPVIALLANGVLLLGWRGAASALLWRR